MAVKILERIKYYGFGHTNKTQTEIIEYISQINLQEDKSLEDIIELFNIKQIIESETWVDESEIAHNLVEKIPGVIGKFFSECQLIPCVANDYLALKSLYHKDFWDAFVEFGGIRHTSVSMFKEFVRGTQSNPVILLQQQKIVNKYSSVLKDYLLQNPRSFELFINYHDSIEDQRLYFPLGFKDQEINSWAKRYCELPDNNSNYLERIVNWSNQHEYKLNPKIKKLARKKKEESLSQIFDENSGLKTKMEVQFAEHLDQDFVFEEGGNLSFKVKFNKNWVLENLDNPTLLMNFIYFLEFYHPLYGFCYAKSGYEKEGLLELFQSNSKYDYQRGVAQKSEDGLYDLIFLAYFDFLHYQGKDLERVFSSFYNEQIEENYHQSGFFFTPSSEAITYYERCKSLVPEMDGILKQYELLREEGEIDEEVYAISSKGKNYRGLNSFVAKKYCYFNSKRIIELSTLLFSQQSLLATTSEKCDNSFWSRVVKGIAKEDFEDYQIDTIEKLIDKEILAVNIVNQLYFKDDIFVFVIRHIWRTGYLNLLYCPPEVINTVNKLYETDDIRYDGRLFSEQESDMISYFMDDKKYGNSMSIRNKVAHGGASKISASQAKMYYLKLLSVLLLYTIRINEEIDLLDKLSLDI